jgi:hypothetical protein
MKLISTAIHKWILATHDANDEELPPKSSPTVEGLSPRLGMGVRGGAVEREERGQRDEDLVQHNADRVRCTLIDVLPSQVDLA